MLICIIYVFIILGLSVLHDVSKRKQITIPDEQWYMTGSSEYDVNINVQEMWKVSKNIRKSRTVTVAILDSGIDILTPEISSSIWRNTDEVPNNVADDDNNGYIDDTNGWNFVTDNNNISDYQHSKFELSHGTAIAGIINANPYTGKICGIVNNRQVKLMPLRVLQTTPNALSDYCNTDDIIQAIQYAESNGADICNISLNTNQKDDKLYNTIKNSKMLFVVSAGNRKGIHRNIDKYPSYPACYNLKNVITVANVKANGKLNTQSNYGEKNVDIAAPGTDIYCISSQGTYSYNSGTSYSTPMVTSMASILYMYDDSMTNNRCKQILCQSSDTNKLLTTQIQKGRILNCENAIRALMKGE